MNEELIKQLKTDEDFYYGWQSNIAMAFYDEVKRNENLCLVGDENLHTLAEQ